MATQRTTFNKRERERAKQAKAAAKRERRQGGKSDDAIEQEVVASEYDGETTEALLQRIEDLHTRYDAGELSLEDFEEQRSALVDAVAIRLSA